MTSRRKPSKSAPLALTGVALVLTAVAVDRALVLAESCEYSAIRLERSFFLTYGAPLYPDPARDAVLNAIYGPVAALAYLPATMAASPAPALLAGHALSMVFFFLPPLLLHLRRPGPGGVRVWPRSCSLPPSASTSGRSPMPPSPSIPRLPRWRSACSPASPCWRGVGTAPPGPALAAVLAVWTKQVMVPLPIALALWLWWAEGRLWLVALARAARTGARRATVAGAALALLLAVELAVVLAFEALPGRWRFRRPLALESWPVERAFRYARAHPGTVYFPRLGLAHAMAEGKVYHQGTETGREDQLPGFVVHRRP